MGSEFYSNKLNVKITWKIKKYVIGFIRLYKYLQKRWPDGLNLINLALDRDQWWDLVNARSGSTQSGEYLNKCTCNTHIDLNKYVVEVLLIGTACPPQPLFFFLLRCDPMRVIAFSFLRFIDHTQRRTTVGRTPLNEWSARRRDLYLTTHNTHNRQTSMLRWDSNVRSQQASGRRTTP
jgi:hypothetical protein